jgi:Laminin G domain
LRRLALAVSLGLSVAVLTGLPAEAEGDGVVGHWGFAVRSGQVADLSRQSHPLRLSGSWARAEGRGGSAAVRFDRTSIARGSDHSSLDPGRRRFAVATAFRMPSGTYAFSGTDSPNLVQKGRYGSRGQWKVQLLSRDGGRVQCRVKGRAGSVMVTSRVGGIASDRRWHRVICIRRASKVVIVVDGQRTMERGRTGLVSSGAPLTVANKSSRSRSDQFRGVMDELVVAKGSGAARAARRALRP